MQVTFRFYEELNDFLSKQYRKVRFQHTVATNSSVKDAIESLGIPHTEVDLILVNANSVDFSYNLKKDDDITVYPKFESIDISSLTRLRPFPLREIKFILDVHLGKLSKYLRLLGFDTIYKNNLDDPEIIDVAKNEKRIILTRDLGILKHNKVTHGYWLHSQDSKKQLKEVIQRFDLKDKIKLFTRCIVCNGEINIVEKSIVISKLLPKTKENYNKFYQCNKCDKIYWEGSHYQNMLLFIKKLAIQ